MLKFCFQVSGLNAAEDLLTERMLQEIKLQTLLGIEKHTKCARKPKTTNERVKKFRKNKAGHGEKRNNTESHKAMQIPKKPLNETEKVRKRKLDRRRKKIWYKTLPGSEKTKIAKKKKSQKSKTDPIETFKREIYKGPTYICTSCHRFLFKGSVVLYKDEHFAKTDPDLLKKCITHRLSHNGSEYICQTCKNSLKASKLPSLAIANSLQLAELPSALTDLTQLEAVFISRRIPFMKLLALPRGKQRAIHGCVVNIPVVPEETASVLPRVPSPATFISVKLKRKLQYRGHVLKQNIRPFKIRQALEFLKHKNHLYHDIDIDELWEKKSVENYPELWDSLTGSSEQDGNVTDEETKTEKEESETIENDASDEEENIEDERSKLSGLPFDSCIQPKDMSSDCDLQLNIAPGEGKKPKPMETDLSSEELSFPQLFPTGEFGFSSKREEKLSLKKYFQARIQNADGRFARNIEYIFYAQYRCEEKEIADSLSLSLRKGREQEITAGALK